MKILVQRVNEARVEVDDKITGQIRKGLLVYLGIGQEDTEKDLDFMVNKVCGLRIFEDENRKMNLSVQDIKGEILVVSQFTLYGNVKKGFRPSFQDAALPEKAESMYEQFIEKVKAQGIPVAAGVFRAMMKVYSVNDGPVTILCDS